MKKILIVDDRIEPRELVEVALRSGRYQLLQAENGAKAIAIAREEKPDLIIMDVMMPGIINGLEATRALKNDPETNDITILMLTVKAQEEDRKKGLDAGAAGYLSKPFSPLELIKKVEEVLDS